MGSMQIFFCNFFEKSLVLSKICCTFAIVKRKGYLRCGESSKRNFIE